MEAKKKKVTSFDFRQFFTRDNLPLICLIILGVFAVVAILVSIFAGTPVGSTIVVFDAFLFLLCYIIGRVRSLA